MSLFQIHGCTKNAARFFDEVDSVRGEVLREGTLFKKM